MKKPNDTKTFIIDDDPFWAAMLKQILVNLGYSNVTHYSNGTDCINNLYQNPGLIFLDYDLGDMNGLQVLANIKRYNADTVVVFCTSQKELQVAVTAMKSGSFDYLAKSIAPGRAVASIIHQMEQMQVFAEKIF